MSVPGTGMVLSSMIVNAPETPRIERQWALQESLAREGDQFRRVLRHGAGQNPESLASRAAGGWA